MRKTNLFGATFLALTASAWSMTAAAQTAAPAPAPAAPMATPAAPMAAPAAPMEAPAATPAPAPDAAPAPASGDSSASAPMPKKHMMMHHKMMHGHGKLAATPAGNKAVEDLNAASLDAAKSGKPFVAPTTPPAAKMTAHAGMHKHHMMKPKGDATAPTATPDTTK